MRFIVRELSHTRIWHDVKCNDVESVTVNVAIITTEIIAKTQSGVEDPDLRQVVVQAFPGTANRSWEAVLRAGDTPRWYHTEALLPNYPDHVREEFMDTLNDEMQRVLMDHMNEGRKVR